MARPNRTRENRDKEDIRMTTISVDLSNYEDDIEEYYCNGNCLKKYTSKDFTEQFKKYIHELDNDLYAYNKPRSVEQILSELKDLYNKYS